MIAYYAFIDGKPGTGLKERQLSSTVQLYNKLSAEETNAFLTKINEIIDALNFSSVPLYEVFALKFKGEDNEDLQNIEAGDIATRYSSVTGVWENALFLGGEPQDPENYENLPGREPLLFTSTGSSNNFTLPAGFIANNLFIDRGLRYKVTTANPAGEWSQTGTTVTLSGATIAAGKKIYITT
jgi:hypothetical protein